MNKPTFLACFAVVAIFLIGCDCSEESVNSTGTSGAAGITGSSGASGTGGSSGSSGGGGISGQAGGDGSSGADGGTIEYATFTMNLAAGVTSSTYVAGQQDVGAVAMAITARAGHEVDFSQIDLQAQASIAPINCSFGQACSGPASAQRITSVALFDGSSQIGPTLVPDQTGKIVIPNLNVKVPAGSTKMLVVKMSLAPTASPTAPYDQIAMGISGDFVATNPEGLPVATVGFGKSLLDQTGSTPLVVQTIAPN